MSIPSATTSATLEAPRPGDEQPLAPRRAGRTWLSRLVLGAVFVGALYLAGLYSGTAPEDFATIVAPP